MDRPYHETQRIVEIDNRRIEGNNRKGRPRLEFIQQIIKDQGCNSYVEMKRKADKREDWKMAANQSTD